MKFPDPGKKLLVAIVVVLCLPAAGKGMAPNLLFFLEVKFRIVQQLIDYPVAVRLLGVGGKMPGQPVKNLHQDFMLLVNRIDARFEIPVPGEYFQYQIFAVVF